MVVELNLPKPFLSEQEIADLVYVDRDEVWLYVEMGAIPAPVQVGRQTYWRQIDIQRWTESRLKM